MKKIYILTIDYPYGNGEPFLKNELPYAVGSTVVSTHIGADDYDYGKLDFSGVHFFRPDRLFFRGNRIARCLAMLKACFSRAFWKELFSEDIRPLNCRKVIQLLSVVSKANETVKALLPVVRKDIKNGDECVFYAYWMNQLALAATMLASKTGGTAVARCHGYDLYPRRENNGYVTFQRYLTRSLDRVCPVSDNGYTTITNLFPDDKAIGKKVCVSRLGTRDLGIGPMEGEACFTVVSCSNVTALKRVHLILQALMYVTEFQIRWIHFGIGDQFEALQQQVAATTTNHHIELRGYTQNADIMAFYQRNHVDVFVNVSESEGIPVSIMEAHSFGIPVIATHVGGVGEIVLNAINGYLISANCDAQLIASYLERVHDMSSDDYRQMRENARHSWEERYSAVHNYSIFYRELTEDI